MRDPFLCCLVTWALSLASKGNQYLHSGPRCFRHPLRRDAQTLSGECSSHSLYKETIPCAAPHGRKDTFCYPIAPLGRYSHCLQICGESDMLYRLSKAAFKALPTLASRCNY